MLITAKCHGTEGMKTRVAKNRVEFQSSSTLNVCAAHPPRCQAPDHKSPLHRKMKSQINGSRSIQYNKFAVTRLLCIPMSPVAYPLIFLLSEKKKIGGT